MSYFMDLGMTNIAAGSSVSIQLFTHSIPILFHNRNHSLYPLAACTLD
jgi:hypothetical protein